MLETSKFITSREAGTREYKASVRLDGDYSKDYRFPSVV
jgi:hypothetical protein